MLFGGFSCGRQALRSTTVLASILHAGFSAITAIAIQTNAAANTFILQYIDLEYDQKSQVIIKTTRNQRVKKLSKKTFKKVCDRIKYDYLCTPQ